jgi:hypothetical protein
MIRATSAREGGAMVRTTRCLAGVVCVLAATVPAAAQERSAWSERAFVAIDVPVQVLNNPVSESLTFADAVRRNETGRFNADYASARGPQVGVGAGIRLSRRLGVGVNVSILQRTRDSSFDLTVPSPIAGNRPLDLSGSVSGLGRREIGVHFQALYPVALGVKSRVMLSAGPSIFNTRQDLVRSLEFDTLPGLTTVRLDQVLVTRATATAAGFNAGAEIDWNLMTHLGLGALTRYSRANVTLDPGSASGVSRGVTLHAGGWQIGGGVRLLF